ncbi:MFS transporter [Paenibacillus sp. WLX2291]|uniref:MFS transporter n=1 Tax=Paenibacillus sp. WLX2291 TaxID=3296934 RepID=UPI0039842DC0
MIIISKINSNSSLLKVNSAFRNLWISKIFATTAFQMLTVTIGWQMYSLTKDAFSLGLVGLVEFIPMILFTLIAGQVADKFNRVKVVYLCQLIECAVILFLLIASVGGWIQGYHILIAAVLFGSSRAFESPTSSALVPDVVDRESLPKASAWNASAGEAASIIGPALGGVLLIFAPSVVYIISFIAMLSSAFLISRIKVKYAQKIEEKEDVDAILGGLRFVLTRKIILGAISLDLFAVLLGGATALLPIFAEDILQVGSWGLGLMRTAPAVGALIMSLILIRFSVNKSVGTLLFGSLIVFGLATVLFALSKSLILSLLALVLIGASDVISVVIRTTLVQVNTPKEMQGRVNAINNLFIGASNQLGEFESGTMAGWFGVVRATIIGGMGTIVIAVLWMYLFPMLRTLKTYYVDDNHQHEKV